MSCYQHAKAEALGLLLNIIAVLLRHDCSAVVKVEIRSPCTQRTSGPSRRPVLDCSKKVSFIALMRASVLDYCIAFASLQLATPTTMPITPLNIRNGALPIERRSQVEVLAVSIIVIILPTVSFYLRLLTRHVARR